jgi:hypothetical protein
MGIEENKAVSGYGSRLESLAALASEKYRTARGDERAVESATCDVMLVGSKLRAEHVSEMLRRVLGKAGYSHNEIEGILDRSSRLITPGSFKLFINWHDQKPSLKEISSIRSICSELADMPVPKCRQILEQSPVYLFSTFSRLLDAELAKALVQQHELKATILCQD